MRNFLNSGENKLNPEPAFDLVGQDKEAALFEVTLNGGRMKEAMCHQSYDPARLIDGLRTANS